MLPTSVQSYINEALSNLQNYLSQEDVKRDAGIAAVSLQFAADVMGVFSLTSIFDSGRNTILRDIGLGALSDVTAAVGVGFNLPDTNQALASLAIITSDLAQNAISCELTGGTTCVLAVVESLLNDFVVPALTIIAQDPPDPNYTIALTLPPSTPILFNTGDQQFDSAANQVVYEIENGAVYLYGAGISLNRYSAALSAGDTSSAVLQLEALLEYLSLYNTAFGNASTDLRSLLNSPQGLGFFQANYDPVLFGTELSAFLSSGFTDSDLAEFARLGIDPVLLSNALSNFAPPDFSGLSADALAIVSTELSPVSASVPEPQSALILATMAGIFLAFSFQAVRSQKQFRV